MMTEYLSAGSAVSRRTPISHDSDRELGYMSRFDTAATAELGHMHLAREIYEHILETQPDHVESLKELGKMDLEQGEYASAISRLQQVTQLVPDDAESFNLLGQACAAHGDDAGAEAAQRHCLALNPQSAAAHYDLGMTLRRQDKLGEATASFQQTLRLDQNHGRAYHQLGGALEEQGQVEQALVCYQEARLQELIDEAFKVGMLQIRSEIEALARTVLITQPTNVMEIGSHRGGTMFLWCKLLENQGRRIALDLPGGQFGGLSSEAVAKRNALMATWSDQLTILDADSHEVATYEKVRETLGGEQLDFLFIDGDHTYEGVKLDYFMYKNFVRPGGLIAFHDIKDTQLHRDQNCRVDRLWAELSGEKMEIRGNGEWGGIGVIQC